MVIAALLVALGVLLVSFALVVLWLAVRLACGGVAAIVVLAVAFCGIVLLTA